MTIAMCYLSPEGVVIGADSTTTANVGEGNHYFNHNQKVFEIGENSTVGVVTWGLGSLGTTSHRTMFALLADGFKSSDPATLKEVAERWVDLVWTPYLTAYPTEQARCKALHTKAPFDPGATPPPANARTQPEENEYLGLTNGLFAGFCFAGYKGPNRQIEAWQVGFDPIAGKPTPIQVTTLAPFWGAPNMIRRLILGHDMNLKADIVASKKWSGTDAELDQLLGKYALAHPTLPIRDAVDFVHACITSTIKALKFSSLSQICGGPVEVAVVTTDRRFRWVRHKNWDAAILEGSSE